MLTFSTSALAASGAVTWGGGGVGIGVVKLVSSLVAESLLTLVQHQRPDLFWQPPRVPLLPREVRHHP